MQACKTHLVGTQKRKTHRIAGVLIILGCISGVYGSGGGGTTLLATSKSAVGGSAAKAVTVSSIAPATPLVSPKSTVAGSAAVVAQDDTCYTFALLSGGDITPDRITGKTKVAELFKKLYEKAKSEYDSAKAQDNQDSVKKYDWSGPEIISITTKDGMIVNETA